MEQEKSNRTIWIVIGILVGVLLVCSASGLIGGAIGYTLGARQAQPCERFEYHDRRPWHHEDDWAPHLPGIPDAPVIPRVPDIPDWPELPERMQPGQQQTGALVIEVVPGSPADDAGLLLGDVIVMVNDMRLPESGSLKDALAGFDAGDAVGLQVLRAGEPMWLSVELGRRPDSRGNEPYLGITYRIMPLGSRGLGLD